MLYSVTLLTKSHIFQHLIIKTSSVPQLIIETKRQHEIHSLSYHFKGNPLQIHVKRSLQAPKNVLESIEEA